MSKITADSLKEKAASHIEIKDGVAVFDREKLVTDLLTEQGSSESEIKKAYDKTATAANAIALAFGEKAIDYLEENKENESVSLSIKIGHENVNLVSRRVSQTQNPYDPEETFTSYGNITLRRTLANGRSELKGIKSHLKEIGAKKLA